MLHILHRLVLPVRDVVDQHITSFPVGGIFTPEKTAINPFFLLDKQSVVGLTNIYFTLAPDEGDGRVVWRYLDQVLGELPETLQQLGFRTQYREKTDLSRLRSVVWSCGSPNGSTFKVLGLSDNPNVNLPVGDVVVIQVKDTHRNELTARLSNFSGAEEDYRVLKVDTESAFDKILRDSRTTPLFELLIPLREKYHTIGTEGVIHHLTSRIRIEKGTMRMERLLGGRDPNSLSEAERTKVLREFLGSKGKEL